MEHPFKNKIWGLGANVSFTLVFIVVVSFVVKITYLLGFSDFQNHFYSDMGEYWGRANQFLRGDYFSFSQWAIWPMGFHVVVGLLLKLISLLGFQEISYELILCFFVLVSSLSVIGVYGIAHHVTESDSLSALAAAFYAFCFPLIYINTFLLPQNLAEPLMILALYLLVAKVEKWPWLILSGISLALAVYMRANIGLLGLPFFLYILFKNRCSKSSIIRAAIFSASFFAVVFLAILHTGYVSRGELKGLSANGGGSFFIQHCKPQKSISTFEGYGLNGIGFSHPAMAESKELGEFSSQHPWHDQAHYYKLGLQCIEENPKVMWDNLVGMKGLLWNPFFPGHGKAFGFPDYMKTSKYFVVLMFLLMFCGYFLKIEDLDRRQKQWLLLGVIASYVLPFYFFGVEPRYLFPAYFVIFIGAVSTLKDIKNQPIRFVSAITILTFLLVSVWGIIVLNESAENKNNVRTFNLSEVSVPKEDGIKWNTWGNIIFKNKNEKIAFKSDGTIRASHMNFSGDYNDAYVVSFLNDGKYLGKLFVKSERKANPGILARQIPLPNRLKNKPFNEIHVVGKGGNFDYSIAHILFSTEETPPVQTS